MSEDREVLQNILRHGRRSSWTPEQFDLMVVRQVSSSLRIDGIDFSVDEALATLREKRKTE